MPKCQCGERITKKRNFEGLWFDRVGGVVGDDGHAHMPMVKIKWIKIRDLNLYGEKAMVGDRYVEVIRVFTGEWAIFGKIARRLIKGLAVRIPYREAKQQARAILEGRLTPDTWPAKERCPMK